MGATETLATRFRALLERHVHKLTTRGARAIGLCPFHADKTPSLSLHLEKNVFYCFGCGAHGGVKKFAERVGESWPSSLLTRQEKRRVAVSLRRREAEHKAHAILQTREEERLDEIYERWRDVNQDAAHAAELLALFHRRAALAAGFADLAAQAACEYGKAVSKRVTLEARMAGEVA